MQAIALALVLVSGQSLDFYQEEAPEQPSRVREARAGLGGATIVSLDGVGGVVEAGVETRPWGPVALRVTVGGNAKAGWGAFSVAPEAVFPLVDIDHTLSPTWRWAPASRSSTSPTRRWGSIPSRRTDFPRERRRGTKGRPW